MALLTVMGLYEYDNTIFENLYLPTGVDREKMIDTIILESAELECIYPAPGFLKKAISLWSATRAMSWDRFYHATLLEYNPIENYDRQESETTTGNREHSGKDTSVLSGQSSTNELNKTAGFDSANMVDRESTTASGTESNSNELTHGEKISDEGSRTLRVHGNIGVTTSQAMLESELDISKKINIYDYIAEEFKNRFCIMIY